MRYSTIPVHIIVVGLFATGLGSCSGRGLTNESANTISTSAAVTPSTPTTAGSVSTVTTPAQEIREAPGLSPGDHEMTILHDGAERHYLIHVPQELSSETPPLIVALHGGGGNATQFKSDVGLDAVSDREGFVVAYPDGTGPFPEVLHTWNAGFNCCGQAQRNDVDDVGFIRAVITDLIGVANIDTKKVAVTGHSNGGIMAYRVAAEASDLVSVAVPVAGAMALDLFAPTSPVAILHIHSLDDPRALYLGGEAPPFPGTNSTVVHEPVAQSLSTWAEHNGCQPTAIEVQSLMADGQEASYLHYLGCSDGGQLEHLVLVGVGHGWPGIETGREDLIGPATTIISASEEVWGFASSIWNDQALDG